MDVEALEQDWICQTDESATIRIYHKPYTHLYESVSNRNIRVYNRFIQLVFKNKGLEYSKSDFNQIMRLA